MDPCASTNMDSLINNPRYKKTIQFYQRTFAKKVNFFNRPASLPSYFEPMIGNKKEVLIADLGAGPVCILGNLWKNVKTRIYASDILQKEFEPLWEAHNTTPIVPLEYQDMENLTYKDNFFDIVYCENALDHTLDAVKALKEMIRVCKSGGWIYLRHAPDQRSRFGGIHAWDVNLVNGECVFSNPDNTFSLSDYMDFKEFLETDSRGRSWIIAMAQKNSI